METGWFPATHGALYLGRASPTCQIPRRAFVVGIKTALFRFGAARGSFMLLLDTAARDTTWKTSCRAGSISRCDLARESERLRPLSQRLLYLLALHPRPRVRVDGRHAEAAIGGWLVAQDQLPDERVDAARL